MQQDGNGNPGLAPSATAGKASVSGKPLAGGVGFELATAFAGEHAEDLGVGHHAGVPLIAGRFTNVPSRRDLMLRGTPSAAFASIPRRATGPGSP